MTFDPPKYHFHESARDIRLEGWTLWANLRRADGSWNVAQLRLNYVLENDNGTFKWDGHNVGESAKDPTLVFWEGYPIVRAHLRDNNNNYHQTDYNLSDRIGNSNGNFTFMHKAEPFTTTTDPDVFTGATGLRSYLNGRFLPPLPGPALLRSRAPPGTDLW